MSRVVYIVFGFFWERMLTFVNNCSCLLGSMFTLNFVACTQTNITQLTM